jgi:hypothetical protein
MTQGSTFLSMGNAIQRSAPTRSWAQGRFHLLHHRWARHSVTRRRHRRSAARVTCPAHAVVASTASARLLHRRHRQGRQGDACHTRSSAATQRQSAVRIVSVPVAVQSFHDFFCARHVTTACFNVKKSYLRCVHHHPGDGVNAQNCSGGNQTMRWSGWDALQKCAAVCEAEEAL